MNILNSWTTVSINIHPKSRIFVRITWCHLFDFIWLPYHQNFSTIFFFLKLSFGFYSLFFLCFWCYSFSFSFFFLFVHMIYSRLFGSCYLFLALLTWPKLVLNIMSLSKRRTGHFFKICYNCKWYKHTVYGLYLFLLSNSQFNATKLVHCLLACGSGYRNLIPNVHGYR